MDSELNLIFTYEGFDYFQKKSGKNTLYYKAKISGSKRIKFTRVISADFWECFGIYQNTIRVNKPIDEEKGERGSIEEYTQSIDEKNIKQDDPIHEEDEQKSGSFWNREL